MFFHNPFIFYNPNLGQSEQIYRRLKGTIMGVQVKIMTNYNF